MVRPAHECRFKMKRMTPTHLAGSTAGCPDRSAEPMLGGTKAFRVHPHAQIYYKCALSTLFCFLRKKSWVKLKVQKFMAPHLCQSTEAQRTMWKSTTFTYTYQNSFSSIWNKAATKQKKPLLVDDVTFPICPQFLYLLWK